MGVKGLWSVLNNNTQTVTGDPDPVQVVSAVSGKRIAVDLSIWMAQAQESLKGVAGLPPQARILKVVFERATNWLRHGVIPVAVLEGSPPPEKLKAIQARFFGRTGCAGGGAPGGNSWWKYQSKEVGNMLSAMGLPFVQAPGEAEATCGELSRLGLVDGVATKDGDALLFGAQVVYKELSLSILQPKSSIVTSCTIEDVRHRLGCREGGADALMAVAALSGGDYDESGLKGVGIEKASMLVSLLLETQADDRCIIDALTAKLREEPREDLAALSAKGCTGCKRCGHDCMSSTRLCTKSRGCRKCGTQPVADGGSGQGGCKERSLRQVSCECRFHTLALERQADKILRLATRSTGLLENIERTVKAYRQERRLAAVAVAKLSTKLPGGTFSWARRPDPQALVRTIGGACMWNLATIRRKVLPLLLEWDIANSNTSEFIVQSIVKVHGIKATEQGSGAWKYLLEVKCQRRDDPERYVLPSSQPPVEGSGTIDADSDMGDTQQPQVPVWEFDEACFSRSLPARTVRMTLVQQSLPGIVQEFRARLGRKENAKTSRATGRGTRRQSAQAAAASTRPITSFFAVTKGKVADGPGKAGDLSSGGDLIQGLHGAAKKKARTPPQSPDRTTGAEVTGYRRGHSSRGPAGRTLEQRQGLAVSLFELPEISDSDEEKAPDGALLMRHGPRVARDDSGGGGSSDDCGPLRVRAPAAAHERGAMAAPGRGSRSKEPLMTPPRPRGAEDVVDLITPPPPQAPALSQSEVEDDVIVLS